MSTLGGGNRSWERLLDYPTLAFQLEFTESQLRKAVAHLVRKGFARVDHRPGRGGDWLVVLTPGCLAFEKAEARKQQERALTRRRKADRYRGGQLERKSLPQAVRDQVFARDGYVCQHCGSTEKLTADHIHPWSLGGPDTVENLQVLCGPCNGRKGDNA